MVPAGRVEIERNVMGLAVLGDPVGDGAKAPGLRLGDLAAVVFDDLGCVFRKRIDLGLSQILTREENMLVERHAILSCWPIADAAQCGAPPAVVQNASGAAAGPCAIAVAYAQDPAPKASFRRHASVPLSAQPCEFMEPSCVCAV